MFAGEGCNPAPPDRTAQVLTPTRARPLPIFFSRPRYPVHPEARARLCSGEITMNQLIRLKPLFRPGRLLVSSDALTALRANGIPVVSVLLRHVAGDWGTVSDEDRQQNDLSISAGLRLISLYRLPDRTRILVITEWDRSSTTIERVEDVVHDCDPRENRPASRRYPVWPSVSYMHERHA